MDRREQKLRGLAVLKHHMVERGNTGGGYETIYLESARDLGFTDEEVVAYLEAHREDIDALCRERGLLP